MVQLRKIPQEKRGRGDGLSLCWFRLLLIDGRRKAGEPRAVAGVRRREEGMKEEMQKRRAKVEMKRV